MASVMHNRPVPTMTGSSSKAIDPYATHHYSGRQHPPPPPPPPSLASHGPTSKSKKSLAALAMGKVTGLANMASNVPPQLKSATSSGSMNKSTTSSKPRPDFSQNHSYTPTVRASGSSSGQTSPTESFMAVPKKDGNTMHQISSKLLRMTDQDRPFTRDFKDLFSTLIINLPLSSHRVRFSRVETTFLSEEAIENLGSLRFSQSNRLVDPSDSSRYVVTTTTTTFSMTKEMARQVCQRFVDARFIESVDGKPQSQFPLKGAVWQLTPKGVQILKRFCDRNGVESEHLEPLLCKAQMHIVVLERDQETDNLIRDKTMVEVVFRRMIGIDGPNLKLSPAQSDSVSLSEYSSGTTGVKMTSQRRVNDKIIPYTFTGRAASDWLLDCCTTVDRRETYEICNFFLKQQLMVQVVEDKTYSKQKNTDSQFQPTKSAIYAVTEIGQRVCGWMSRHSSVASEDDISLKKGQTRAPKDTSMNRLRLILKNPALRMMFREHLRFSLCEENLNFYQEAQEFLNAYRSRVQEHLDRSELVKEFLATAYGLYTSFLAAGAPSELNIDHLLRSRLDICMTQTNSDDRSLQFGLASAVQLIDAACRSIAKLMASDSVPKFMRDYRYQSIIQEHQAGLLSSTSPVLLGEADSIDQVSRN